MKKVQLLNESGLISDEAVELLIKRAPDVSCQCPGHLIEIFRSIQAFTDYQKNCINAKPQDELIHKWLESTSLNLEHILSNSIITLARMEGMIDENNQIIED
jgi:hypothetical protein